MENKMKYTFIQHMEKIPREVYDMIMIEYIDSLSYINQLIFIDLYIKNNMLKKHVQKNLKNLPENFNVLTKGKYKKVLKRNYIKCENIYITLLEDTPKCCNGMEMIKIWEKLGFNLIIKWEMMTNASKMNNTEIIKYLIKNNIYEMYYSDFLYYMLIYRNYEIMEIIDKKNLKINTDYYIITELSSHGMLDMIEWLYKRKDKYKFMINEKAMEMACSFGHINVLDWFKNNNLCIYDEECISQACYSNNIQVLNWWLQSNLELKISKYLFEELFEAFYFNLDSINWIKINKINIEYDEDIFDNAYIDGNIGILDWWHESGMKIKYSKNILGHTTDPKSAEWILEKGYEVYFTQNSLDNIESVEMLEWWLKFLNIQNSNFKINKEKIIQNAIRYDNEELLKYCIENDF